MSEVKRIGQLTYPIFLGYVSVGFVFGMMAVSAGVPWFYAVASSVFLYAGASQFLLVNSVKSAAPLLEIFIAVFLLNLRHVFYFRPVAHKIEPSGPKRWYSILSMTDEAFALISDSHVGRSDSFLVLAFSQSYWILGTFLGAVLGGLLASSQIEGLDFSLLALFTVLFVEKLRPKRDRLPLLACVVAALVTWFALPASYFLIVAISAGLIIAVLTEGATDDK